MAFDMSEKHDGSDAAPENEKVHDVLHRSPDAEGIETGSLINEKKLLRKLDLKLLPPLTLLYLLSFLDRSNGTD